MPSDPSTHILEAHDGRAVARLRLQPDLPPLAASGAVLTLGNAAALAAGRSALCGDDPTPERHPQPMQLSVNLFHPAHAGILTAKAETIYQGRSTLIVDVKVRDGQARLVAALVVTQLAPARRAARLGETPARLVS